eukprot:Hpha_TRINITY_DN7129_c0_g1::TRINITY_DN7129_c0_g1_i2::g.29854::m.29854
MSLLLPPGPPGSVVAAAAAAADIAPPAVDVRLPGLRHVHGHPSPLVPPPPPRPPEDLSPPTPKCRAELTPAEASPVAVGVDIDDCRAVCERLLACGVTTLVCVQEPRELTTSALSAAQIPRASSRSSSASTRTTNSQPLSSPRSARSANERYTPTPRMAPRIGSQSWAACVPGHRSRRPFGGTVWAQGLLLASGDELLLQEVSDGLQTPPTHTPTHRSSHATFEVRQPQATVTSAGVTFLRRYQQLVQSLSAPCDFVVVPVPDGGVLEDEHAIPLIDDLIERLFHYKQVVYMHSGDESGRAFALAAAVLGVAYSLTGRAVVDYLFRCTISPVGRARPTTQSTTSTDADDTDAYHSHSGKDTVSTSSPLPLVLPSLDMATEVLAQSQAGLPSLCSRRQFEQLFRLLHEKKGAFLFRPRGSGMDGATTSPAGG